MEKRTYARRAKTARTGSGNRAIARYTGSSLRTGRINAEVTSKYGNKKIHFDGYEFDSKREAERWWQLKCLLRVGIISELRRQVPYELLPTQKIDGKVVERSVKYIADFVFKNENGETVVEDAKGYRTEAYKIKKKLMLYMYGIRIKEV